MQCGSDYIFTFLRSRYINASGLARPSHIFSSVWSSIKGCYEDIRANSQWLIGKHSSLHFWNDNWLGSSISDQLGIPISLRKKLTAKISDFYVDDRWHFSDGFRSNFPHLCASIESVVFVHSDSDVYVFRPSRTGSTSCKIFYLFRCPNGSRVAWGKDLWRHYLPLARSLLMWRAIHDSLPTDDKLSKCGFQIVSRCHLCATAEESIDHLFSYCSFAVAVWQALGSMFDIRVASSIGFFNLFKSLWFTQLSSQLCALWRFGIIDVIHNLWYARN